MSELRTRSGAAVAADFSGSEHSLVEDTDTGDVYAVTTAGVVVKIGPGAGGTSERSYIFFIGD